MGCGLGRLGPPATVSNSYLNRLVVSRVCTLLVHVVAPTLLVEGADR